MKPGGGLAGRAVALLVFVACAYGIWRILPEAPNAGAKDLAGCLAAAAAGIEARQTAGEIGGEEAMILRQAAVDDCRKAGG